MAGHLPVSSQEEASGLDRGSARGLREMPPHSRLRSLLLETESGPTISERVTIICPHCKKKEVMLKSNSEIVFFRFLENFQTISMFFLSFFDFRG